MLQTSDFTKLPQRIKAYLCITMGLPLISLQHQSRTRQRPFDGLQEEADIHCTTDSAAYGELLKPTTLVSHLINDNVPMGNKRYGRACYIIPGNNRVPDKSWQILFGNHFNKHCQICQLSSFYRYLCSQFLDNFQWGNQPCKQRRGRSSTFLIGSTDAAHHVNPFLNFT